MTSITLHDPYRSFAGLTESQIRSRIEYLIQSYNSIVLLWYYNLLVL